jgi:3-methylcrotonyl-CoA carboxylase alpha subunit
VRTNLAFLISTLRHGAFAAGKIDTGFIERHKQDLIPAPGTAPDDALFFAAAYQLLERRRRAGASPWARLDGWRVGGVRQEEIVRLTDGGTDRNVAVRYRAKGWHMTIDGRSLDVDAGFESDGSIAASLNGRRAQARVLCVSGDLVVLMQGRSYAFTPHDPLEAGEHAHEGAADLRAPMPGKIVQIMAKAGDKVRRGQPLAIIEAMKMEHTLASPGDLTVKAAPFAKGDQVNEGAVIVSFEEE